VKTANRSKKRGPGRPPIDPELKRTRIHAYIPAWLLDEAQDRADDDETSRNEVIVQALEKWLVG
jgi:hypothetical protein